MLSSLLPTTRAAAATHARAELVRRALKTCGPTTAAEVAARLHLKGSKIERNLAALEAQGAIFRGHFTRADVTQWCERYNLERIHRMTLARVRAEIEPCADHEYAAFRLRWMHVGGAELAADQNGVAAVLDQLSGIAATPEIWEHAILPARIAGYRPEMLDLVCMSGQMKWVAVPAETAEGSRPASTPSRVTFVARKASLFAPREEIEPEDAKEHAVMEALGAAGAQYLDEVAERANISERDALSALWRMAAAGRVSNDNFAPLRMFADDRAAERALESVSRRPDDASRRRGTCAAEVEPRGPLVADTRGRGARSRRRRHRGSSRSSCFSATEFSRARCWPRIDANLVVRNLIRAAPARIWRHDSARMVRAFALGRTVCAAGGGRDVSRGARLWFRRARNRSR